MKTPTLTMLNSHVVEANPISPKGAGLASFVSIVSALTAADAASEKTYGAFAVHLR
jgi:hypothetical protein